MNIANYKQLQDRLHKRRLDCKNLTIEEAEYMGEDFSILQRDLMFWLGDLFVFAKNKWPDTYQQVFPEWVSPGMLARAGGVSSAYPYRADRRHQCTYTQYMQAAGKPNRDALLEEMAGMTSDESRQMLKENPKERTGWLLAIDCNYFLHRFWHSGAGIEAASSVSAWIGRLVERFRRDHRLTDVACCFDSRENHRKDLTADWEDKYKDRPKKDPELAKQIQLLQDLLEKQGFACVTIVGMEADDLMASYATQFPGKVTLLTQDKDQRQCLSSTCNILLDVEWELNESTAEHRPKYQWLTHTSHTEETGIPPEKWTDYQAIMGDNVDGIKGVVGIGAKGAADLIKEFGDLAGVIQAAKEESDSIKPKKRTAILEFEDKAETTLALVTMRNDLDVPFTTKIAG